MRCCDCNKVRTEDCVTEDVSSTLNCVILPVRLHQNKVCSIKHHRYMLCDNKATSDSNVLAHARTVPALDGITCLYK